MSDVEAFIADMADSVVEVKGTPRQIELYKASLRMAIAFAKRRAAAHSPSPLGEVRQPEES